MKNLTVENIKNLVQKLKILKTYKKLFKKIKNLGKYVKKLKSKIKLFVFLKNTNSKCKKCHFQNRRKLNCFYFQNMYKF